MVKVAHFLRALLLSMLAFSACPLRADSPLPPAHSVQAILNQSDSNLDYVEAALAFDRLIDNKADTATARAVVARLVDAARQMAGPHPTNTYKLAAVRKAIYEAGPWNYNRAFSYDLSDPLGANPRNKMLSTYVRSRKGNCVSMPALFLIVADRLGLNVRLAAAPLHLFVRYTDPAGAEHNLEATSGGHEARTAWYRANLPMSDRSIASGLYMRTLSRRETVAAMAMEVLDFLFTERRFQEAADVADSILTANSRDGYAMVKKGTALGLLLQAEFVDKYASPGLIPPPLRARSRMLAAGNEKGFRDAAALGWQETPH